MKILLFGASGQVGHSIVELHSWLLQKTATVGQHGELLQQLSQYDWQHVQLIAYDRSHCDMTRDADIKKAFAEVSPDVVINAAAYTNVEKAEDEVNLANSINHTAAATIADLAKQHDVILFHYSTEYLFDGKKIEPYLETDSAAPLNAYGQSKLAGEQAIRHHHCKHYILRCSWVFAKKGNNFLRTMLKLAQNKTQMQVVNDQFGAPTPAADIAKVTLLMLAKAASCEEKNYGTYHYASTPTVSWYEFAKSIIAEAKNMTEIKVSHIQPISAKDYPVKALRPINSRMDTSKLLRNFGINTQPWQPEMVATVKHITSKGELNV